MPQKVHVLLRIQAPSAPPAEATARPRPPHHIALALDRSGSMSGQPLAEAVRCARHIVDRLHDTDHLAIVVFDHDVQMPLPLAAAHPAQRAQAHRVLDSIHSGGNTNLHGGWAMAAQALADGLAHIRAPIRAQTRAHTGGTDSALPSLSRVLLLSDGNANEGIVNTPDIVADVARHSALGVSTSTYGLGHNFNEDLMVSMARQGQGNHYYGATANDLFEPFAEEFDLISQLYARQLSVTLTPAPGVRIEVLNDHPFTTHDGHSQLRLPDLPYDAETWAVLQLSISARAASAGEAGGAMPGWLLQASLNAQHPDGKPLTLGPSPLSLPAVSAAVWENLLPDPAVEERRAELHVATVLRLARQRALDGDSPGALRMLQRTQAMYANNPWSARVLDKLRALVESGDLQRFSKEAVYASRKMSARLTAVNEIAAMDLQSEHAKPRFLRRRDLQGSSDTPQP